MQLTRITYKLQNQRGQNDWIIDNLELGKINLILGKNATGKSRVAQVISSTAKMISQQISHLYFGSWRLVFSSDSAEIVYEFKSNFDVESERIYYNDDLVLKRDNEKTSLFSFITKEFSDISPPKNKLVLHVRRDKNEYPFLEPIAIWAEKTYGFKFGNISPYLLSIDKTIDKLTSIDEIPSMLQILNKEGKEKAIKNIIREFNSLGYDLERLGINSGSEGSNILIVHEKFLKQPIPQNQLSQGMFRALSLLIFLEYLSQTKDVTTIIVDDLCEGLDYDRAIKLGTLLISKLEKSNIQFIATSNDRFLMEVIPIQYWNILTRKNNVVKTVNYYNSKEKFENFMFTGLSNFDLFSSDYLTK